MPPDVGATPQFEAPALAELNRAIDRRPPWQVKEPLLVDPDTFERCRLEMRDVLDRQGRPLAVADWMTQENFLLRGTPVVKAA